MSGTNEDDDVLVMRMRSRHVHQLHAMIKMHLSFLLELLDHEVQVPSADSTSSAKPDSGWRLLSFSTRYKSKSSSAAANSAADTTTMATSSGALSGGRVVLSQEGVCQVYQLIEFLGRRRCLQVEGLFRKTGNIGRQQELGRLLVSGVSLDLDSNVYSAHDCACVLKWFLSSLTEPLLTSKLYSAHIQAAALCSSDTPQEERPAARAKQIKALQLLFLLLPSENYQLLKDLLMLLHRVAANRDHNRMTALNLGTVFAPHLLCRPQMSASAIASASSILAHAVAGMVSDAPRLFVAPKELMIDIRAYLERHNTVKAGDEVDSLAAGVSVISPPASSSCHPCVSEAQVSTVFTFVDRQRSAAAGRKNDTETELANLYAHVSAMPNSARKRKLIKQFNRENGAGTPLTAQRRRSCASTVKQLAARAASVRRPAAVTVDSPMSPYSHRFRECGVAVMTADGETSRDAVSMYPTPSLAPRRLHRRSLLTPGTAAAVYTLTRGSEATAVNGFRQQQLLGPTATSPLPGIARREKLTSKMHAFRTGRHNSMRHGQMPLRAIQLTSTPHTRKKPISPISCHLSDASSGTIHQMMTPRNRRAVCLLSHGSLSTCVSPSLSSARAVGCCDISQLPATDTDSGDTAVSVDSVTDTVTVPDSAATVRDDTVSLDSGRISTSEDAASSSTLDPATVSAMAAFDVDDRHEEIVQKTSCSGSGLSSPFERYMAHHNMIPTEDRHDEAMNTLVDHDCDTPGALCDRQMDVSLEAAVSGQHILSVSCAEEQLSVSLLQCLDGQSPHNSPENSHPQHVDGCEVTWADASSYLDSVKKDDDDDVRSRRRTLTDRGTNPLALQKTGAGRSLHTVVFETNL